LFVADGASKPSVLWSYFKESQYYRMGCRKRRAQRT